VDGGDIAWEGGQRVPVQLVPVECIPGNEVDPEDQSRAEVLDTVLWTMSYLARFKRPALGLDVLAVVTGLIIFNPDHAIPAIAKKHHIRLEVFERLVSRARRQIAQVRESTGE